MSWVVGVVVLVSIAACSSGDGGAPGAAPGTTRAASGAASSAPASTSTTPGTPAAPGGPPSARASIARTAVEKDGLVVHRVIAGTGSTTVVVHAEAPATTTAPATAVVEIVSVGPDASILARRQIRQPVPATASASGRTMFDGAGDPNAATDAAANEAVVKRLYTEVFNGRNVAVVDVLVAPEYAQHNPAVPDGVGGLKALAANGLPATVKEVVAQGDLVAVVVDYGTVPAVDIFRLAGGKIVEHWDVLQLAPAPS